VKALRKQRDLTQAQLAAEIGVGLSTIGTIESVGAVIPEPEDAPEDLPDDGEDAATEEARITARLHDAQLKSVALIEELNSLMADDGAAATESAQKLRDVLTFTQTASAEDRAKMDRAEVADAISASGLTPALAMALLAPAANVTPDTAAARIAHAKALADICAAAGLPDVAADYATKNTDLETARAQLIAVKAEDGPEIVTAHPAKSAGSPLRAAAIYEERRKATE